MKYLILVLFLLTTCNDITINPNIDEKLDLIKKSEDETKVIAFDNIIKILFAKEGNKYEEWTKNKFGFWESNSTIATLDVHESGWAVVEPHGKLNEEEQIALRKKMNDRMLTGNYYKKESNCCHGFPVYFFGNNPDIFRPPSITFLNTGPATTPP